MRAVIKQTKEGTVVMSYTDKNEDRKTREFICPTKGGYVYEFMSGKMISVCSGLQSLGDTLRASHNNLIDVIREEYRKAKRFDLI